jgi:hypothetical protein
VLNPDREYDADAGLSRDAYGVPSGVAIERRRQKRRHRRHQTPTAQLVTRLTELTNRLQTNVDEPNPPVFSKSTVDAEVQCDLVEAPPLKRRRLVNVMAGVPQQTNATATPTVAALPPTIEGPSQPQTTSTQPGPTWSLPQHINNNIYRDLVPVTPTESQTTWILPHSVIGSVQYIQLPPAVPPAAPTDPQSTTSGVAAVLSPTTHIEAPDYIATSDDD